MSEAKQWNWDLVSVYEPRVRREMKKEKKKKKTVRADADFDNIFTTRIYYAT